MTIATGGVQKRGLASIALSPGQCHRQTLALRGEGDTIYYSLGERQVKYVGLCVQYVMVATAAVTYFYRSLASAADQGIGFGRSLFNCL